jgi:hypothetical protein
MTPTIWERLSSPPEFAVVCQMLGEVLAALLDDVNLDGDSEGHEYRQHYADDDVKQAYDFAHDRGLLVHQGLTVVVNAERLRSVTVSQLAEVFVNPRFSALAGAIETRRQKQGDEPVEPGLQVPSRRRTKP